MKDIFELPPDLSPDLEWMLQSSQSSEALIVETLVREFFAQIFRLACSILDDPQAAWQVTRETLASVPANRHRFFGRLGVKPWIFALTLETCRKYRRQALSRRVENWIRSLRKRQPPPQEESSIGSEIPDLQRLLKVSTKDAEAYRSVWKVVQLLGETLRLSLILRYVHGLSRDEIAHTLGTRPGVVRKQLSFARRELSFLLESSLYLSKRGEETVNIAPGSAHQRTRSFLQDRLDGESPDADDTRFAEDHLSRCQDCQRFAAQLSELDKLLAHALPVRWPAPDLDEVHSRQMIRLTKARIEGWKMRQRLFARTQQVLLGGIVIALVLAVGWRANLIAPKTIFSVSAPQTVEVTRLVSVPKMQVIRVTRTPRPTLPPPLLTVQSDPEQIRERIMGSSSLWHSLWIEAQIIRYGPPGYVGPPLVYRNQVWIDQPDRRLVLSGPSAAEPNYVLYRQDQAIYEMDLKTGLTYYYRAGDRAPTDFAEPRPSFLGSYGYVTRGILDGSSISQLIFPSEIVQNAWKLWVSGSDTFLGRPILVVEATLEDASRSQLWVDAQTGMVLRWLEFDHQQPWMVSTEMVIDALKFGVEFPENSFSAYYFLPDRFVWDNEWRPPQPELAAPTPTWNSPPGREPLWVPTPGEPGSSLTLSTPVSVARSRLTFQWQPELVQNGQLPNTSAGRLIDLFADGSYLGRLEMGNPWNLFCERSPDGEKIAFLDPPDGPDGLFSSNTSPSLFNLTDLGTLHAVLPNAVQSSSDFAFSPDSRYLAFWGCGGTIENCGIYLQDTESFKNKKLVSLDGGASLFIWSPDGGYLAMLRTQVPDRSTVTYEVLVVQVSNGQIVYRGEYDWLRDRLPPDAPISNWGVQFPPTRTGLEGCISPPVRAR